MTTHRNATSAAMFLLCRTLGHSWFPIPAEKPAGFGDAMWFHCERCDAERYDAVGGDGRLLGRRYVYDPGYRHAFDDGFADAAPTRSDFRRMLLAADLDKIRRARRQHSTPTKRSA